MFDIKDIHHGLATGAYDTGRYRPLSFKALVGCIAAVFVVWAVIVVCVAWAVWELV